MRLTKRMEDGSYAAVVMCKAQEAHAVNYQIVQKLGKYEDIYPDPDILKGMVICCCDAEKRMRNE